MASRAVAIEVARFEVPDEPSTLVLRAPAGTDYEVRFRTAGRWSEPIDVTTGADEGPDDLAPDAMMAAGPLRVPSGADAVEIGRTAGPSAAIDPSFLLDAEPRSITGGVDGDEPEVAGLQQVAPGERPAIMPRSSWATDGWAHEKRGCASGPSTADNVRAIVVHHTVTSNSYAQDEVDDLLRAIYHAHVRVNGWCDIGYNFVIDRFGTIWEARSGGIEQAVIGGHAKGFNTGTAGVAFLGQHHPGASPQATAPSDAASAALESLASWKLRLHGVDPTGTTWLQNRSSTGPQRLASGRWHLVPTVMGHRDLGVTSCPGGHGYAVAQQLPTRLAANHPGPTPYRWSGWRPSDIGTGFVVLDGGGQVRPAGSATLPGIGAPVSSSPAPVRGTARAVAAQPSGPAAAGYVLTADGGLTPYGGSPAVTAPALPAPAVDVALGGSGGWVVAADGTVAGFGGAADLTVAGGSAGPIVAADIDRNGNGYLLESDGDLRAVGNAPAATVRSTTGPVGIAAVDIAVRPRSGDGDWGGWVLDGAGNLHPFGAARTAELTSPRRPPPGLATTAVAASATGNGGWILTADGQLWPFGHERLVLPATTMPAAATTGGVDVALLPPVVSDAISASATGRYLGAVVELFLDRPATPADIDHWYGRLTFDREPPTGRRAVTIGLAQTDEWAGQRVDALYRDVLGRSADAAGRRFWVDELADGLRFEQVGVYFYGSAEYVEASGSAERYVDRLYSALLGRAADPDGRRYWVDLMTSGRASPPEIASGFYASVESRRGRVRALYLDVLGREPDASGLDHWTGRLLDFDDILLAAELAASDELFERTR